MGPTQPLKAPPRNLRRRCPAPFESSAARIHGDGYWAAWGCGASGPARRSPPLGRMGAESMAEEPEVANPVVTRRTG